MFRRALLALSLLLLSPSTLGAEDSPDAEPSSEETRESNPIRDMLELFEWAKEKMKSAHVLVGGIRGELVEQRFQTGSGGGHFVPLPDKRHPGQGMVDDRCSMEAPPVDVFFGRTRFGMAWRGQVIGLPAARSLGAQ